MKQFKRIGVLTSGGDAPGMNAAVRAVVRSAIAAGVEVLGIYRGYSGLIDGDIRPLALGDVSNIVNKGGTFLYSDRCPEFKTPEGQKAALANCKKFGIEGVIAIGGDGTFRGASVLSSLGIPTIGIPATIDNDISSTDNTIGFDTAMNTVLDLVDKLRDTGESHARCNVVEVMGRGAGDIALNTAIGAGATTAIVAEFETDVDALLKKMMESRAIGKRNFVVIISEAMGSDFGPMLNKRINDEAKIDSRFVRIGHIVRGGNPTMADRLRASRMGVFAVEKLLEGKSDLVVCERKDKLITLDIRYALVLDHYYKGIAKPEDMEGFTEEQLNDMKEHAKQRAAHIQELRDIGELISL